VILLVSGATTTVRQFFNDGEPVGRLVVPRDRNAPSVLCNGQPWAADNGSFSSFDPDAFVRMLDRWRVCREQCLFVALPDVVGDWRRTLKLYHRWFVTVSKRIYPTALVAQDGLERRLGNVPWGMLDAIFIGGSTSWKLGPARLVAAEAKRRGKWLHVGRVNSRRRLRYCIEIGADSVDGSGMSRYPETKIGEYCRFLRSEGAQQQFLPVRCFH